MVGGQCHKHYAGLEAQQSTSSTVAITSGFWLQQKPAFFTKISPARYSRNWSFVTANKTLGHPYFRSVFTTPISSRWLTLRFTRDETEENQHPSTIRTMLRTRTKLPLKLDLDRNQTSGKLTKDVISVNYDVKEIIITAATNVRNYMVLVTSQTAMKEFLKWKPGLIWITAGRKETPISTVRVGRCLL